MIKTLYFTAINQHTLMLQNNPTKNCLACGKTVKGRADKKFCDDYCRNAFNNQLKTSADKLVININNALKKNRRILESILSATEETAKVNKEKLLAKGYQFKYFTHLYSNKKGNQYCFCYDFGYLPLENDWYLIVKARQEFG
jgi:predicted nucleic acid-binding Zn ribbon protein